MLEVGSKLGLWDSGTLTKLACLHHPTGGLDRGPNFCFGMCLLAAPLLLGAACTAHQSNLQTGWVLPTLAIQNLSLGDGRVDVPQGSHIFDGVSAVCPDELDWSDRNACESHAYAQLLRQNVELLAERQGELSRDDAYSVLQAQQRLVSGPLRARTAPHGMFLSGAELAYTVNLAALSSVLLQKPRPTACQLMLVCQHTRRILAVYASLGLDGHFDERPLLALRHPLELWRARVYVPILWCGDGPDIFLGTNVLLGREEWKMRKVDRAGSTDTIDLPACDYDGSSSVQLLQYVARNNSDWGSWACLLRAF